MSTASETPDDRSSSVTLEIPIGTQHHDWLIEVQDTQTARQLPFTHGRLVIGTSKAADVVLADPTVSSRHCALSTLGSGITIEDLGSTNGTFVGNARVREAWGSAGTTVTIGHSTLVFRPLRSPHEDESASAGQPLEGVAGASVAMRRLASQVRRLARLVQPVLVFGETGCGKELIARALHREGPRASRPFVVVNMGTLPRELIESELFGHERGSFTGATTRRMGAFREAEGGTLFLDEIGELPLDAQPKLLRALDGYELRSVGGTGGSRADVRVIAATHQRLEELVTEKLFRRDLFHRLEAFVLEVPPLRERRGDIAAIARAVLEQLEGDFGERRLTPGAVARLASHPWPGNVRELRNVILRACDIASDSIDAREIELALRTSKSEEVTRAISPTLAKALLREHDGNLSAAARAAGCPRTTFRKLLGS